MRKLTRNEQILVISVSLLLVLFVLKNLVLGPIYEKTGAYINQIEQSKMVLRKYLALEHNRAEILKAQKQIEGYSSLRGSNEDQLAMVMSKIEAEARKSKLQILDMSSAGSSKVKGGIVTFYRVTLRGEGQLGNILDFISGLEGATILMQVEKIALTAKDEIGSALRIEATILGVSFS